MAKTPIQIKFRSRFLRKTQTVQEELLWSHLRRNNFGIKFKRQVALGPYIVDLCCKSRKIVIELDGSYHKSLEAKDYDFKKNKYLNNLGYKVLRFWNREIDKDLSRVINKIIKELN